MSAPEKVFDDGQVELWHGDYRDKLRWLTDYADHVGVDAVITDPPYGDTELPWDKWPEGWLENMARVSDALWTFGSFRMFHDHGAEFDEAGWKYSQDVVYEKQNGTGLLNDRFRRIHEHAVLWYQGRWDEIHHDTRYTMDAVARRVHKREKPKHLHGKVGANVHSSIDGGPRMMTSVIKARNTHGTGFHPTQKPLGIIQPLIEYSVPVGGMVLDPFGGSATTAIAARNTGRRAIVFEADPQYIPQAVRRLSQHSFDLEGLTE